METTMTASAQSDSHALAAMNSQQIATYRREGFLHTPGILTAAEATDLRDRFLAATGRAQNHAAGYAGQVFDQYVNLWQQTDATLLDGLARHSRMRATATALAGEPLRLWHDHLLVKRARNEVPTEWHHDQPFWPHEQGETALSAWVALVDVPQIRGCMSYIPGSHRHTELAAQDLQNATDLFHRCPQLQWQPSVTVPVKAGDVVWHHARTAHRAEANRSEVDRVVVSVIYMPRSTRFSSGKHICTTGRGFERVAVLAGPNFPDV
jgi:phytanoyl-CoA hydroxylase